MSGHEQFEELAALGAVGELSAEELALLKSHVNECESCRRAFAEFSHVVHEELPTLHKERTSWRDRLTRLFRRNGHKKRFLERATEHGFRFSPEVAPGQSPPVSAGFTGLLLRYALPAFVLVVVALVVVSVELRKARSSSVAGIEEVRREVSQLSEERGRLSEELRVRADVIAELEFRLARAENGARAASGQSVTAERERDQYSAEARRLQSVIDAELAKSSQLQSQLQDRERRLTALNQELEGLRNTRAGDTALIASQQRQLDETTQELRAQKEVFDREHELLAANRDIRELMGARNLHIIDVFDADQSGRNRRAFGRVFYTEGKSLIFYAFDLNGSKLQNAKQSFQAWGVRDGQPASARSLGIFYADDAAQRRWVLKFEDPKILGQIDAVFVTVEPFGGAVKPGGQKLLYAFLKNPANHP